MLSQAIHLLPQEMRVLLERLPFEVQQQLEEIRIREGRPLEIGYKGKSEFVAADGTIAWTAKEAYLVQSEQCRKLLEKLTNYSLYAMDEELRRGYITVAGGHRVGLAGRTVLESGYVKGIRDIGAFNIRIAKELIGSSRGLLPKLLDPQRRNLHSVLIIAPPQQGKTTLIRDISRVVSSGDWPMPQCMGWQGRKVGIVDERSEIAACVKGVPAFNVGPRTDVMDACPKAEGMMMLIRSMSPELIAVDEIGRIEDAEAISEAGHSGIKVAATAHAFNFDDALSRPVLRRLMQEKAFELVVQLRRTKNGMEFQVKTVDEILSTSVASNRSLL